MRPAVTAFLDCRRLWAAFASVPLLCGFMLLWVASEAEAISAEAVPHITHHALSVALDPASHRLDGQDRQTLAMPAVSEPAVPTALQFTLAPSLQVTHLRAEAGGRPIPLSFTSAVQLSAALAGESTQVVTVQLSEPVGERVLLDWQFEGTIHDTPREPRHLRFVTPSETSGHIGPEGVYLSGESQWYPDLSGSLPTFEVRVRVPRGWSSVTHGRRLAPEDTGGLVLGDAESRWEVPDPTEALTLVANQFVRASREWTDGAGRTVLLETDLLPDHAGLADEYLSASAQYLDAYSRLLGPYPFAKFAVVENFFASGLGMPSFTLLGSGVIKRHYVQPYALGHEIVHSWIGNAVFNRPDSGNWVEGLTTYLANYYYDELVGREAQAKEQRRLMLAGYAVYVSPEQDYPVAQFMRKTDQKDNAIGYQKAAMVFHALRRELGDERFFRAIRRLGERYRGQYVDWTRLEALFAEEGGRSLRRFFAQWVEQAGAPYLGVSVHRIGAEPVGAESAVPVSLGVRVEQLSQVFQVELPVLVEGAHGERHAVTLPLAKARETFSVSVPFEPAAVWVDPDYHLFRRIGRAEWPPMLNLLATDTMRTVVVANARNGEEASVYRRIVERLTGEAATAEGPATVVVDHVDRPDTAVQGSLLFLGEDQFSAWAAHADPACAQRVSRGSGHIRVDEATYEDQGVALLVSCPRRQGDGHVATWFFGTTPESAGRVARLLFFYGWQSYLVFRDGAAVARGDFGRELGRLPVTRE